MCSKKYKKFYGSPLPKRKEKILSKYCLPSSCCQNVSSDTNFLRRKINLRQSCAKLQKVLGYWLKSLSLKWLLTEQQPFLSQKVFVRNRGQKHSYSNWAILESEPNLRVILLEILVVPCKHCPPKSVHCYLLAGGHVVDKTFSLPFSVFLKLL